eukprot:4003855-Amphidinium_carterae.1
MMRPETFILKGSELTATGCKKLFAHSEIKFSTYGKGKRNQDNINDNTEYGSTQSEYPFAGRQ